MGMAFDGDATELVRTLVEMGVSEPAATDAVRRGDPESAVFERVFLTDRAERTVTPAEIAARGGPAVEQLAAVMTSFGLPAPGAEEPTFSAAEADVFIKLQGLADIWPPELVVQLARVYGEMLSRIAGSEAQAFWLYTVPQLRRQSPDMISELAAVRTAFEHLLPLADPLLTGVHRRWVEHELGQAAVRDAETRAGVEGLPNAVNIAFLFCDLKDFTRYAEIEGDAAAITAIDRFFEVVARCRGDRGRLVKSLGDGAMLVYDDAGAAVEAGARVIAAMQSEAVPRVHASVHYGVAIAREGDFFGSNVNLAARLLALSGPDELVATEVVVKAAGDAFSWLPIGDKAIRGVVNRLPVFRLVLPGPG